MSLHLHLWTPQLKKTKPESNAVACNFFYARAEHLKELKLETHFKNDTSMNYNFHCYNFNHTYIFLNILTLKKTLILLAKMTYLVTTEEKYKWYDL